MSLLQPRTLHQCPCYSQGLYTSVLVTAKDSTPVSLLQPRTPCCSRSKVWRLSPSPLTPHPSPPPPKQKERLAQVWLTVQWRHKYRGLMGFAVRVRSAGQKYGPTCHQRDRADVTEFFTLVRLSSLGRHVGVLALAGYKRRKSALTAGPITATVLRIALIATFALQPIAGAQLYMMTLTEYIFLNRSVSGPCDGINVPHPSQI